MKDLGSELLSAPRKAATAVSFISSYIFSPYFKSREKIIFFDYNPSSPSIS